MAVSWGTPKTEIKKELAVGEAWATIPGLLFVVFLSLKLTGTIGWSWWAVTMPLWAPALLAGLFVATAWLVVGEDE